MKIRQGYVYKQDSQWYARFDYKNPGMPTKKTVRRKANPNTKSSDKNLLKTLLEEYSPQNYIQAKTLREYAEAYAKRYLIAPKYVQGKKVAGQRAWKNQRSFLKPLIKYFGKMNLTAIGYHNLENYRLHRLNVKTSKGNQRGLTSVHRELSLLRRMLNVAVRDQLLRKNPFELGETLIKTSEERKTSKDYKL